MVGLRKVLVTSSLLVFCWFELRSLLCVGPLPFHEIQSLSGKRSLCVQVFYSLLGICCSRCCASFFLRSYVLIV